MMGYSEIKGWKSCSRCWDSIPVYEDADGYYWSHSCNYVVSVGRESKPKSKVKSSNEFIKKLKDKNKERWQRN